MVLGLLMEVLSEKKQFKNIQSFRCCESLKKAGEWIVIVAIVIEVIVAGFSATYEWQNAPLNQPAQSAKAVIDLWTEGTGQVLTKNEVKVLSQTSSKVAFGTWEMFTNAAPNLFSSFPAMVLNNMPTGSKADGTNTEWEIRFDRDEFVFRGKTFDENPTVSDVFQWQKFEIVVPFLMPESNVLRMNIELTVNNSFHSFTFSNLVVENGVSSNQQAFWTNPSKGVVIFWETNQFNFLKGVVGD